MKKYLTIIIVTFSSCLIFAQDSDPTKTQDKNNDSNQEKVEEYPIFPGCEEVNDQSDISACFQRALSRHVQRKFDGYLPYILGLEEGIIRIFVTFAINKEGLIENVKVKAPHIVLEDEAKRVMESLPRMIPGKLDGKPIRITQVFPLTLVIEGDEYNRIDFKKLTAIETPIFPGCDSLAVEFPKKCFEDKISEHISSHLNKELALDLEIEERKKIVYVSFQINQDGEIEEVDTYGAHRILTKEAIRVIHLLPTMKREASASDMKKIDYHLTVDFR